MLETSRWEVSPGTQILGYRHPISCQLHQEVAYYNWGQSKPGWGASKQAWHMRQDVCCSSRLMWARNVASTMPYQDAVQYCQVRQLRLCLREEICPNGHQAGDKPLGGFSTHSDSWVPTADSSNSWVQVAKQPISCQLHQEVTYYNWGQSKPGWGASKQAWHMRQDVCCTSR